MQFEWSEEKEARNLRKHQMSLAAGMPVFDDPLRIERRDDAHSSNEERYQTMGMVDNVLFVAYTERDEVTRLISVRPAEPKERRIYYGTDDSRNSHSWHPANA
jgi:uncharacterized DUF497 family protein